MSKPFSLDDIFVVHNDGSSSQVPVHHRTIIPQHHDTPVLVIEEEEGRIIIEIRSETKEHYNQMFEQILMKLTVGVKGIYYNEWNPPPVHGRLIIDY